MWVCAYHVCVLSAKRFSIILFPPFRRSARVFTRRRSRVWRRFWGGSLSFCFFNEKSWRHEGKVGFFCFFSGRWDATRHLAKINILLGWLLRFTRLKYLRNLLLRERTMLGNANNYHWLSDLMPSDRVGWIRQEYFLFCFVGKILWELLHVSREGSRGHMTNTQHIAKWFTSEFAGKVSTT